MTHGRRDDFAEIRAILSQTAQRQAENTVAIAELRQTQAENTVAIAELRQAQSENLVAIAELRQGLSETRQVCDSNARSLEAMQSRIDGSFDLHERKCQNSVLILLFSIMSRKFPLSGTKNVHFQSFVQALFRNNES